MLAATSIVNDVASLSAGQLTAGGILAIVVLMILTGRLATGKERDYWRDMALELLEQNGQLIHGAETTVRVVRSLPEVVGDEKP